MTTLYKPVLIESAEQAEALPIGTYAVLWNTCRIAVKVRAVQWDAESGSYGNRDMLMAEALVPIEAEEETWLAGPDKPIVNGQRIDKTAHRWCTPWEEA